MIEGISDAVIVIEQRSMQLNRKLTEYLKITPLHELQWRYKFTTLHSLMKPWPENLSPYLLKPSAKSYCLINETVLSGIGCFKSSESAV